MDQNFEPNLEKTRQEQIEELQEYLQAALFSVFTDQLRESRERLRKSEQKWFGQVNEFNEFQHKFKRDSMYRAQTAYELNDFREEFEMENTILHDKLSDVTKKMTLLQEKSADKNSSSAPSKPKKVGAKKVAAKSKNFLAKLDEKLGISKQLGKQLPKLGNHLMTAVGVTATSLVVAVTTMSLTSCDLGFYKDESQSLPICIGKKM